MAITDIWDYPETEAVFPPSEAHELIVWLSLDSLASFWAEFVVLGGVLPGVRDAARAALAQQDRAEPEFNPALSAQLPQAKANELAAFVRALARLQDLDGVGPWRAFFGEHQHNLTVAGLCPDTARMLSDHFKSEVVAERRARSDRLRSVVSGVVLSAWDLAMHDRYGFGGYRPDRFDKNVVLVGLDQLTDAVLFHQFLTHRVMALTDATQVALLHAVRSSWADLAMADPIAAMKGEIPDGNAIAAAIPPASELVRMSAIAAPLIAFIKGEEKTG